MKDLPQFGIKYFNGVSVIEVRGDLDLTNVGEFEATLNEAADCQGRTVVVSLRHASYFDSKGVHVLLRAAERLAANRVQLRVVAPRAGSPRRILEIAGIPLVVLTFESVEEALTHRGDDKAG